VLNEDLMETILESNNCRQAYRQVKANAGAAGVDGMTVERFAGHAREHWPVIKAKRQDGRYRPGAVRGVCIPKPNGGNGDSGFRRCKTD
jgi:RNA-directed DNA polymerase